MYTYFNVHKCRVCTQTQLFCLLLMYKHVPIFSIHESNILLISQDRCSLIVCNQVQYLTQEQTRIESLTSRIYTMLSVKILAGKSRKNISVDDSAWWTLFLWNKAFHYEGFFFLLTRRAFLPIWPWGFSGATANGKHEIAPKGFVALYKPLWKHLVSC